MTSMPYNTLVSKLQSYTEDDGDDFTNNIDTIIQNGMEKVVRDLKLEIFKTVVTGAMTISSNFMDKNPDILVADEIYYLNNSTNKWRLLRSRSYGFCQAYWPTLSNTGTPRYYNDLNENQIFIVPTPNFGFSTKTRGVIRPDPLSSSNQENWLTTHVGDLVLYSCLTESEGFLMALNDGRVQQWKTEYMERLPVAREELQQISRTAYEPINRNTGVSAE